MVNLDQLRRHQTIAALIAEIGSSETVIAIEEGAARQYSFSQLSNDGTLVVVERRNADLEFFWYANPQSSRQDTPA